MPVVLASYQFLKIFDYLGDGQNGFTVAFIFVDK